MSFTLWANNSSSEGPAETVVGGGGCVTVMRAVASCVPPEPLAVSRYVVESAGETDCVPLGCTAPIPSMETSVALLVCQVSVADCPFWIVFGSTEIDAVGDAVGGGGGGGGGAAFFLQAPNIMMAPKATTSVNHFMRCCITI